MVYANVLEQERKAVAMKIPSPTLCRKSPTARDPTKSHLMECVDASDSEAGPGCS